MSQSKTDRSEQEVVRTVNLIAENTRQARRSVTPRSRLEGAIARVTFSSTEQSLHAAYCLLLDYLGDFPEHDQGDYRVFAATEMIETLLNDVSAINKEFGKR